jgi:cell division protein FtsX
MIYTLAFIAFFILLMAVINFVNLSISRSSSRMKEIGIRKVLGGMRRELIRQFLVESVILSVMATVFGLLLYTLFAPVLSNMLGKEVPGLFALPAIAWLLIPAGSLTIGCLAGAYPAFVLSSLRSVDSLKGRSGTVKENIFLRKALVGFQFATATVVFVGAIIVGQQIRLFFSDRLGYDKEYIVSAQLPRDWTPAGVQKMETVRDMFAGLPAVKEATLSFEIPDGMNSGSVGVYRENGDSAQAVIAETLVTDRHYAAAYQIPMASGVFFNGPGESDANNASRVVINEAACRALGWNNPQDAIGRRLHLFGSQGTLYAVSGVIRDFHFGSMSARIEPSIFVDPRVYNIYRYLSLKLRPGNIPVSIDALQKQWSALLPGAPFEYRFMDNVLQNLYQDELRLKKAASAATLLALVIVLLGVVGLLALSMQKRRKEIAIRKVIGASMRGIIRLFLKEFLPVMGIAGLAAAPLAWWIMPHWLDDYATRIRITPWPFLLAVLGLGLLMSTLIIIQTASAALENPVKSLKAE